MIQAEIKRLPKYAQDHIISIERTNIGLQKHIKKILDTKHPNSKISYRSGIGTDRICVRLPANVKIEMIDQNGNIATIHLENDMVNVYSDGSISIQPKANNYIGIRMSKY